MLVNTDICSIRIRTVLQVCGKRGEQNTIFATFGALCREAGGFRREINDTNLLRY
jgi:hypothetical protein